MSDQSADAFSPLQKAKVVKLFPFENHHAAITLYTIFSVLKRMRRELGLEAMIEYMDFYQNLIEKYNPQFKNAVGRALDVISVEKIYADAMKSGGNDGKDSV